MLKTKASLEQTIEILISLYIEVSFKDISFCMYISQYMYVYYAYAIML